MPHFQKQVQFLHLYMYLTSVFICTAIFLLLMLTIVVIHWSMKEASRRNLDSGSTATIVLIANDQILVANIGDSKAFLCSEKFQSPAEAKGQKQSPVSNV